ncbi:MAG: prepilin-type N-terminal cleavage/methylation domain-containing protein [candidate division Zixibacteria bacterium]|nr:prepilin-type N-terminal cleavage/methylation domain-containing protein [candidate division Zixibacteria bacterium]
MLSKFHRSQKGFTLIELMIVVVIIGILAALAIPRFMRATTKSKQSEAKNILKQVYAMERAYRQEKDVYWITGNAASAASPNAFGQIGIDIMASARYSYTIGSTDAGATNFTATATSGILDDDAKVDTWTMTDAGVLTCTSDDAL